MRVFGTRKWHSYSCKKIWAICKCFKILASCYITFNTLFTNKTNFSVADDKPALYSLKIDSQSHFSFGCSATLTSSSGQLSLSLPSSRLLRLMTASPSFTLERLQNNNKNKFTWYICNARPNSAINSLIHENYIRKPDPSTDKWTMNISIRNSMICSDILHKYHEWYFKIVIPNFKSH